MLETEFPACDSQSADLYDTAMNAAFVFAAIFLTEAVHVEVDGVDGPDRDGLSQETAFGSLAYACEQLGEGPNVIHVGPGKHIATRPAFVPGDTKIFGRGFHGNGENFTRIVASSDWPLRATPCEGPLNDETLVVIKKKATNVVLTGLQFESPEDRPITGGVAMDASSNVKIDTCRFRNFRWFGIQALACKQIEIARSSLRHCSTVKCQHRLGQISTRWLSDSTIHNCRITPNPNGGGYGYKGGGHTNVRIHDNTFEPSYFSIESPHENEFGLEIDHNILNGAVSVPKGGPGADPSARGHEYSVELHHNLMTDSYAIEGPRNHLRVHHNHIRVDKTNGRIYTQFGGINHGPVRIDHNIIENVDRSIVWVRNGLAQNITFEANTVFAAAAPGRAGLLFSAWTAEHIDDWIIRDNVIVASWNQPRVLLRTERDVPTKMTIENNLFINVTDVPEGNTVAVWPNFRRGDANKPWDYFSPANENGPTVDTGQRTDEAFAGKAPDIGAVEYGLDFGVIGPRR